MQLARIIWTANVMCIRKCALFSWTGSTKCISSITSCKKPFTWPSQSSIDTFRWISQRNSLQLNWISSTKITVSTFFFFVFDRWWRPPRVKTCNWLALLHYSFHRSTKSCTRRRSLTLFTSRTTHTPSIKSSRWRSTFWRFVRIRIHTHAHAHNFAKFSNSFPLSCFRNWSLNLAARSQSIFCVGTRRQRNQMPPHT